VIKFENTDVKRLCSPNVNFLKITYGTYCCFSNYNLSNWGSLRVCFLNIKFL